jgi:general secretion pathway protein E/type IV pilus assembly protein PilB
MRQSPDVILVGEVRDEATASAVMRAVMTGHQVFSTLHTIDAAGVIQRLVDLGVSPSLISGNLSGIISQRLVQKLCGFCKKPRQLTQKEITDLKLQLKADQSPIVYEPNGCEQCKYTGYQGRVAAIEVLEMTTEINEYILEQTSRQKIYNFAVSKGFIPLKIDLKRKVLSGITSLNEAQRVFNIYD